MSLKGYSAGILVFSLLLTMSGCGSKQEQQAPPPKQQQLQAEEQSDKVPDQLKGMEESIEKIIKTLGGPSIGVKEDKKQEGGDQKGGGKEGENKQEDQKKQEPEKTGGGQQGQQGQQPQQGQQGQPPKQGAQQPQPKDPWQEITGTVNSLHYQWNSYMPTAVKKGANRTLVDNFSTALNNLTNAFLSKNQMNTLMAASQTYSYVPDFYSLYRTKNSPEIKRIRYHVRNALLNSLAGNWAQAESDINSVKSSWSLYKNTLGKEQQDNANKLDFSILELEKVVKEKNQPLTDIKGRVAMSNIEALEKAAEEQEKKEAGNQGGQGAASQGGGQ